MRIGKGLERAWRNFWIGAIAKLVGRTRPPERPDWKARPHRVLFLRHDRIGDMILSTGLIRAIAESYPTIELHVLAAPGNARVLREDRHVREVVLYERSPWKLPAMVRALRRARYDAVVDPMPTAASLTTLLLMMASGARHRVGVAGRGIDEALTVLVPPRAGAKHLVDHLSALAAAFGVEPASPALRPRITLADEERARAQARWRAAGFADGRRRLLVNVSAGKPRRRWPDEHFAELLRRLHQAHPELTTLVIGGPPERESVARIAQLGGAAGSETPGLRDAFALVATADCVLTPDTSISHAASAFRVPAVVLFNPGYVGTWGLYHSPGRELASPRRDLASLPPEPVLAAVEEVLEGLRD